MRVLGAIDGGLSKMQAHKTFNISRSTIDDWLALREQTGNVQVMPSRAGRKGLHQHEAFAGFVLGHQHSTLEQMRIAWLEERQQAVSLMSFSSLNLIDDVTIGPAIHQYGLFRRSIAARDSQLVHSR